MLGALAIRAGRLGSVLAAMVAALFALPAAAGPFERTPPYPPSPFITSLNLDWGTLSTDAQGSDNWHTTWARDGQIYTSWGDGGGFGERAEHLAYVQVGIARLTGASAREVRGENLIGGLGPAIAPCVPVLPGAQAEATKPTSTRAMPCYRKGLRGKTRSLLALGDKVFMFISPGSSTRLYEEGRLYAWKIGGNEWERASWAFTQADPYKLLPPALLQAGRDHADLGDGHVYAYAPRLAPSATGRGLTIQKGPGGGQVALLRARRDSDLLSRASWQFFAGLDADVPRWTGDMGAIVPVITDRNGVGWAPSAIYVKELGRYLVLNQHGKGFASRLAVLESRNPWGPWFAVAYFTLPSAAHGLPQTGFFYNVLPNSVSADGRRLTLVISGKKAAADVIALVDASLTLDPAAR